MSDQNQQPTDPATASTNSDALVSAKQKIAELTEVAKRALADLANYKKRVEEERTQFAKFANVSLVLEILPVLDNFSRAFSLIPPELKENEWVKGVMNIEKQLVEIIRKNGIVEIPSPVGQPLDHNLHEPVMAGLGAKDTVVEELEKGYTLEGKVIRPVKVKVGDGSVM